MADASSEFGVLVRTRIDCHLLFIGAEIDCFDSSKTAAAPVEAAQQGVRLAAAGTHAAAGAEAVVGLAERQQQQQQQQQQEQEQEAEQQAPAGQQQAEQQAPSRQPQPPPPGLQSFLELKTYRLPQHPQQQRSLYRFKHPKWWLQSFLAGVPRLALGARDDKVRCCAGACSVLFGMRCAAPRACCGAEAARQHAS